MPYKHFLEYDSLRLNIVRINLQTKENDLEKCESSGYSPGSVLTASLIVNTSLLIPLFTEGPS